MRQPTNQPTNLPTNRPANPVHPTSASRFCSTLFPRFFRICSRCPAIHEVRIDRPPAEASISGAEARRGRRRLSLTIERRMLRMSTGRSSRARITVGGRRVSGPHWSSKPEFHTRGHYFTGQSRSMYKIELDSRRRSDICFLRMSFMVPLAACSETTDPSARSASPSTT